MQVPTASLVQRKDTSMFPVPQQPLFDTSNPGNRGGRGEKCNWQIRGELENLIVRILLNCKIQSYLTTKAKNLILSAHFKSI